MTIPTFKPPRNPDQGSEVDVKPAVLTSTLGDQYVQRAPNGINTQMRKQTLKWTNLLNAEANQIIAFFKLMGGYLPFYWTPNGEDTPLVFVCTSWKFNFKNAGFCDITSAEFEESPPT